MTYKAWHSRTRPALRTFIQCVAVIAALVVLSGCASGRHNLFFFTKTNIGVNIDAKPPTVAEVSISRDEGVIEPPTLGGKNIPVLSSLKSRQESLFGFGVSTGFAAGDAATTMTKYLTSQNDETVSLDSLLVMPEKCMTAKEKEEIFDVLGSIKKKAMKLPFVTFLTTTTLGLKVSWTTGSIPDGMVVGFKRKEFAATPVAYRKRKATDADKVAWPDVIVGTDDVVTAEAPSLLATLDYDVEADSNLRYHYVQYFATGECATQLALKAPVRNAVYSSIDPKGSKEIKASYKKDEAGDKLRRFWKPDGVTKNAANEAKLKAWMTNNGLDTSAGSITFFIRSDVLAEARAKAVKELNIQ